MAEDPLKQLETWAAPLLAKLEPAARRTLARTIATDLRRSQRQRIAAQKNPDGSAYTPRKPRDLRGKQGRIKRRAKAMFGKLRRANILKTRVDQQGATLGFFYTHVARIARVHHYGLRDRVARGGTEYQYPARQLLGFSSAEVERVRDLLLQHLTR